MSNYGGSYQQYGGNPYEQGGNAESGYGGGAANPYSSQATSNPYASQAAGASPYGSEGQGYGSAAPHHHGAGDVGRFENEPGYAERRQELREHATTGYGSTTTQTYSSTTTQGTNAQSYSAAGGVQNAGQPGVAAGVPTQPTILSNQDFLARVENTRSDIRQLTNNVSEIGMIHQRVLSSPDSSSSAQLDSVVSNTQILNTRIRDQIKSLETDTAKSGKNTTKESQIRTLKGHFKSQLEDYQREERTYRQRYQEQIARQYRIVNPEASESEVQEAATANWGDEGVFQTALKSNRSGAASSVLGSVRARHNDIQKIEATLVELNQLFIDLAQQVELQEPMVESAAQQTEQVKEDTQAGNKQLDKGIKSARRARKLKWWCFFIVVLIVVALALILGLYFGLPNAGAHAASNSNNNNNGRRLA